jgi:hypothetical protein
VSVADREAARMTYAALTASQQMIVNQQTPPQLAALMALAQAQRTCAGRKVMVYFTAGLDADSRTTEMIKTAVRRGQPRRREPLRNRYERDPHGCE